MDAHDRPYRRPRASVFLRARIDRPSGASEHRVRDVSEHGACVDNDGTLVAGEILQIAIGRANAPARVVWADQRLAGFLFERMILLADARRSAGAPCEPKAGWLVDRPDPYRRRP